MDTKPDTIKVSAFQREEIHASHADLFVTVKGASIIGGQEALKKAGEVNQLVEALTAAGVAAEDIHLQGVQFDSSGGALLKSSSASYRLRVRCNSLDKLPGLLDVIGARKNAALDRVEWKYPEEAARERGLDSAISRGRAKAGKVAAALGVTLLGVYDFIESTFDEEQPVPFQARAMPKARAAAPEPPGLDLVVQHSKTVTIHVDIWYRVSSLKT